MTASPPDLRPYLFIFRSAAYCVLVNLRDRREYKRFLRHQQEAWQEGDITKNQLHRTKKSFRKSMINRLSKRMSFKD